ncbi:hypothetical protein [Lysobacter capsici]|uniref:hypothetical protein n=1 Tax=Lysobacter capsici TaxID=435897 RepID=UPI00287BAE18|nr:hypothetical protein [Lysobacter capsici]WND79422.1 hypothetical protein RJ610_19275 [Lysobacter capsici]WND84618.1 hypothetical protein RJ609_19290 [Lysobacter capsici]
MSAWINTADRLPEIANEESAWVLIRHRGDVDGGAYVAQLRESVYSWSAGDIEIHTCWVLRGQDCYEYDLADVVAWAEIPA